MSTSYQLPTDDGEAIQVTSLLEAPHGVVEVDQLPDGTRLARVHLEATVDTTRPTPGDLRAMATALEEAARLVEGSAKV